ncbi:MAG: dTDP-4-dehydrorhamnose 3,5-epimerase [Proteobacteria bacterium]|nr:dTDP-4-dehydrorhamnose 3,5-epimerase [Pseudomonadota bacterium]
MRLQVTPLNLPDVRLIHTDRHADPRGYFSESYVKQDFAAAGITSDFIQDNESMSVSHGTVRGLHFQIAPFAQAKLIRVLRGAIFDVALDIRGESATYGQHACAELTAATGDQLLIPAGFAHGFCTLEPDTVVIYKTDNVYSPRHERGVYWADPALAIAWPLNEQDAVISAKDRALPPLAALTRHLA